MDPRLFDPLISLWQTIELSYERCAPFRNWNNIYCHFPKVLRALIAKWPPSFNNFSAPLIAGGFPSYLLGHKKEFSDIDIFILIPASVNVDTLINECTQFLHRVVTHCLQGEMKSNRITIEASEQYDFLNSNRQIEDQDFFVFDILVHKDSDSDSDSDVNCP